MPYHQRIENERYVIRHLKLAGFFLEGDRPILWQHQLLGGNQGLPEIEETLREGSPGNIAKLERRMSRVEG
jgi:hypothetical protein